MTHHLPQKVLHSKGGSHKDTLLRTPLLWDTPLLAVDTTDLHKSWRKTGIGALEKWDWSLLLIALCVVSHKGGRSEHYTSRHREMTFVLQCSPQQTKQSLINLGSHIMVAFHNQLY